MPSSIDDIKTAEGLELDIISQNESNVAANLRSSDQLVNDTSKDDVLNVRLSKDSEDDESVPRGKFL